jgi:hypothetical protein
MKGNKKKSSGRSAAKLIIGRQDRVDLPAFGFKDVPCKIDTGANTNAINCDKLRIVEKDGVEILSFELLDSSQPERNRKEFRTTDFKERKIRNSFGVSQDRYVISTTVRIFGREYETEFSLSDRERMKFPVLLGARFLRRRFLVDVAKKDLSYKEK